MQQKLLLFCGPSGSGKTTVVHHLLSKYPKLSFSISATTRNKRINEKDGEDYHFMSVDDFKRKIEADEFIEWEEVYHNGYYGTLKSEIERISKLGKVPIFDVDVEGGINIKKQYGKQLLAVFVMPPSLDELHHRLKARATETPESFKARTAKSEHEMSYAAKFDHVIVNDKLEDALIEAEKLVKVFLNK
jgi:guanylate kinase